MSTTSGDNSNGKNSQISDQKAIIDCIEVKSVIPKHRHELLKWNGWGYKDSKFVFDGQNFFFTGNRYPIGGLRLPHFVDWAVETLNINFDCHRTRNDKIIENKYPKSNISEENLEKIKTLNITYSINETDRVTHAHGQTLDDMYILRNSLFKRIPDLVLWPQCHDDVVKIVNLSTELNFIIIPFGGGTAVSGAIQCPTDHQRTIISLDTTQMNRILWIDTNNLIACCESGIIGQDLERELKRFGYTTGHEPDSYEFSSLGGWIATRASGMKKNTYGNIEDLLINCKLVTTTGVLTKNTQVPRLSCGPDFHHIILGSEGTFGVITDVLIKIRPIPKRKQFGSIVFPTFESGLKCMREVARKRCQPSSIRLMDNGQFKFGMILKTEQTYFGLILDGLKKFYITKIKGFNIDYMCVMTLLFEGDVDDVKLQEKKIYEIGKQCGGIPAGQVNGERGYMLTFVIAYIRDLALEYSVVAESFETSVPWDRALTLCNNVKYCVKAKCMELNIKYYMINCRVTQTYDSGCVIYFYLAFNHLDVDDNPVKLHQIIETAARNEILANGGSISHHHGVGKLRKEWYPKTVTSIGVSLFNAIKNELDPNNVFATNNLIPTTTTTTTITSKL